MCSSDLHVERIIPVVAEALARAGVTRRDVEAVAVAVRPGLVGSLLVGLSAAKAVAAAWGVPLVGYDHVLAHLYACRMHAGRDVFPAIGLVVSGGHCNLYDCPGPWDYELLGSTIDDAVGECFDKTAKLLGLGFPGGPAIEREAMDGNDRRFDLPRPMWRKPGCDFSFSGLKTAVRLAVEKLPDDATARKEIGRAHV